MEIGTYIEKSVDHELSGNIIDLCPVGALNNKPYRFSARAWEMTRIRSSRPRLRRHQPLRHVLRGQLMRVVPRDNEAINEMLDRRPRPLQLRRLYTEDRCSGRA